MIETARRHPGSLASGLRPHCYRRRPPMCLVSPVAAACNLARPRHRASPRHPAPAFRTHFPLAAGDARGRAMGEAMAAARVRPTRALRATAAASTHLAPRGYPGSRFPVRQVAARARSPPPAGRARRGRRRGEELKIWNPGNLGSPRTRGRIPGFQIPQLADSRSLPATAAAGLRLADAVIALASRPWSKQPLSTATARAVKRA